jgi:hypothetical protein
MAGDSRGAANGEADHSRSDDKNLHAT